MDPRVLAHFDGDMSRANIHPRKRHRVLARYPGVVPGGGTGPAAADAGPTAVPDEVLAARCPGCGYTYRVEEGDEHEGFAAGTAWADVPDSWCCPDCGVREKVDFVPLSEAAA
jgi:alkane 1-monooxygenase